MKPKHKFLMSLFSVAIFGFGALVICTLHFVVLPYYDLKNNAVLEPGPYSVPQEIKAFHEGLFVADLHADSLLWKRNLRRQNTRGQVDLPRLRSGGVDLQVFGVVTKVPSPRSLDGNADENDGLPLLFIAALRPLKTWFSPKQRALVQAKELGEFLSEPDFSLVLNRDDLARSGVKGLLALEGMHGLEAREEAVMELYSAGFRMMGLAHFFDNDVSGSAHGRDKGGLTDQGRRLIVQMEKLGITVDLAHASMTAIGDTLRLATKPVVVSHGGVEGTCPGPRNLSDAGLRAIARNGGVVGIGFWKTAVCDASLAGIVKAITYAVKVAGVDHVGLGSDFDGHVATPFDVSGLVMLTEALLRAGLSRVDVGKVMGGNIRRVLFENLPTSGDAVDLLSSGIWPAEVDSVIGRQSLSNHVAASLAAITWPG